jgi:hypothetical protein
MGVAADLQSMYPPSGLSGRKAQDCWIIDYSGQMSHIEVIETTKAAAGPAPVFSRSLKRFISFPPGAPRHQDQGLTARKEYYNG